MDEYDENLIKVAGEHIAAFHQQVVLFIWLEFRAGIFGEPLFFAYGHHQVGLRLCSNWFGNWYSRGGSVFASLISLDHFL